MDSGVSLSDDYVAELLKKDAKSTNIRFSALGLHSVLPTRPTTAAPKPNTRFLRNIIRETDSHNASLLAREADQSNSRLKALRRHDDGYRSAERRRNKETLSDGHHDEGRRHKRRRLDDNEDEKHQRHRHHQDQKHTSKRQERDITRPKDLDRSPPPRTRAKRPDGYNSADEKSVRRGRSPSPTRRRRHRSRSEEHSSGSSPRAHAHRHRKRRHRSRIRTASSSRERKPRSSRHRHRRKRHESGSPSRARDSERINLTRKNRTRDPKSSSARPGDADEAYLDSDPLEAIIGPPPPPAEEDTIRPRGRGAFVSSSTAMDTHFSATYDPRADVRPNSESEDDWDQALEALRDRQRWKQQGAQRLRSAGFTQEEVDKWATGGEKREDDVRWAKRGEGREWDRGKVVDDDGAVDVRPEWGRLKGT